MKHLASLAFMMMVLIQMSLAQTVVVPFNDKNVSYEGRVKMNADNAELIWSGTSVRINFAGTNIAGRFKDLDTCNYYNIIVDGKLASTIHFDNYEQLYTLAENLKDGKHSLQLFKRTEWDKGKTLFYGFEIAGKGKTLKPSKLPKRKIEFFGNSITCGYAIEEGSQDRYYGYFENNYNTYAALTARHFNAQYHCTSKSGIGVMVSWFPLIMPEMYNRLDPTDPESKWDFSLYTPDVVVINLFQNDSWLVNMPEHDSFKQRFGTQKPSEDFIIDSYRNFVKTIRSTYPNAQIICMLGNMDATREGSPWPGYIKKAVDSLGDAKMHTLFAPYKGTPEHPNAKAQKAMADLLINYIEKNIKW